jgi:preprotein translocase subunit SecG
VHEKVLEQFHKLTADDGILIQTVRYVKASNTLTRSNYTMLRRVNLFLFTFLLLLALLLTLMWKSAQDIRSTQNSLADTVHQLEDVIGRLNQLQSKLDAVKSDTKNIKDEQQAQPKVELVPEPDPAKAKDAPLKVRITPPTSSQEPPAPTVEVSIPVRDTAKK